MVPEAQQITPKTIGGPDKAAGEIPRLLEELNTATLRLQDLINNLGTRLAPVLPNLPISVEPVEDYVTSTDMGDFIATQAQRVTNLNNYLSEICSRVEL